jgi:hypothetical protein
LAATHHFNLEPSFQFWSRLNTPGGGVSLQAGSREGSINQARDRFVVRLKYRTASFSARASRC